MFSVASFGTFSIRSQRVLRKHRRCYNFLLAASSSSDASTSFPSSSAPPPPSSRQEKQIPRQKSNTGGLRRLPVVKSPPELINKARNIARIVKPDSDIKNIRNRARKHGAETLNALTQALCIPLRNIVNGYKEEWKRLHPFERVVADLTVRAREKRDGLTLHVVLDQIHEARKLLLESGKDWIYKVKNAETAKETGEGIREGIESMVNLFQEFAAPPVSGLLELQRSLRSAPIVQLDAPAVVLVGAPNVGKSSIVRAISSADPEVNNYPFTTRGMTLGHVEVFWSDDSSIAKAVVPKDEQTAMKKRKYISEEVESGRYAYSQLCQVMDSPGLLVRDNEDERNEMEALTLAAMQHLPTAVMYVMDFSGAAGDKCSSISDQLQLRRQVRARFPRRPWIDVVSKFDLGVTDDSLEQLEEIQNGEKYVKLSIHEGVGVDELKLEVLRMLGEVRVVLDAMAALDDSRTKRP